MKTSSENLVEALDVLQTELDWNQSHVAEKTGASLRSVNNWFNGHRRISNAYQIAIVRCVDDHRPELDDKAGRKLDRIMATFTVRQHDGR
jgi:DNA-binding transcriptional regulator YdaS (Cro superfamily)